MKRDIGSITQSNFSSETEIKLFKNRIENAYSKLVSEQSTNFTDFVNSTFALKIIDNYIKYLFKDDERDISVILEIPNNGSGTGYDLVDLYSDIQAFRNVFRKINGVESKIRNSNLYNKLFSDPCNCNDYFDGMADFVEELNHNPYYTLLMLPKLGYPLTRETVEGFKLSYRTTNPNNSGGV